MNILYAILLSSSFFLSCILNRYLTESYGTGQDIDDRIVEGIVSFYFLLLGVY
jgi:hypothetical protein